MEGNMINPPRANGAGCAGNGASPQAVIVSRLTPETEFAMLNQSRWQDVVALQAEGCSISEIARRLGIDRKTVRSGLRKQTWQPYRREPPAQTLLSEHMVWIAERAPRVHYSARILYQELRQHRGYTGSYDTIRNAVRPLRAEATVASVTQRRFETGPGEQAQVDWGQIKVPMAEGPGAVHVFIMTLGYSRRAYAEGFTDERSASLLEAHERAFAHFGGRPAEILYDRMRTVLTGTAEGKARWNPTFEAFARGHWGFELLDREVVPGLGLHGLAAQLGYRPGEQVGMLLVMALEAQREVQHAGMQQLALGAQLIGGDRLEFGAEGGVGNLNVLGPGAIGLSREGLVAGEQRHGRTGQRQSGAAEEQSTGCERGRHLEEGHRGLPKG